MNKIIKVAIVLVVAAAALPAFGVHPVWSLLVGGIAAVIGLWGYGDMEEEGFLP